MGEFFYSLGGFVACVLIIAAISAISKQHRKNKATRNGKKYLSEISSESDFNAAELSNEMKMISPAEREKKRNGLLETDKFVIGHTLLYIYTTPFGSDDVKKISVSGEAIFYLKKPFLFLLPPSCRYIQTLKGKDNHLECETRYERYEKDPIITEYRVPLSDTLSIFETIKGPGYHKLVFLLEGTKEDIIKSLKSVGDELKEGN